MLVYIYNSNYLMNILKCSLLVQIMLAPNRCNKSEVHSEDQLVCIHLLDCFYNFGIYLVVLMGKNTMIRKAIRGHLDKNPGLEKLLPHIKGNIGFVFTKEELKVVRDNIQSNKVSQLSNV